MPSNIIYLVMDAGTPVAVFTARRELKAYLRRRLEGFIDLLVYTFGAIRARLRS